MCRWYRIQNIQHLIEVIKYLKFYFILIASDFQSPPVEYERLINCVENESIFIAIESNEDNNINAIIKPFVSVQYNLDMHI